MVHMLYRIAVMSLHLPDWNAVIFSANLAGAFPLISPALFFAKELQMPKKKKGKGGKRY